MHTLALICLVLAGVAYCASAVRWWAGLRTAAVQTAGPRVGWLLGIGFGSLTLALIAGLMAPGSHDVAYMVLGAWAAMSALHFAFGFLTAPTRSLLALPVGCLALLLALGGVFGAGTASEASTRLIVILHSVAMSLHLGVALVAGGAGGLYLVAARQLKRATPMAFRLPPLPVLERTTEVTLVLATAALMVGIATGGAAIGDGHRINLSHPSVVIAFLSLALLAVLFALRLSGRIHRRGVALVAVQTMMLAVLSAVSLVVVVHG